MKTFGASYGGVTMELINREDIKYTNLFAEMTGIPVKTVAKVSIDDMPTYTIDDLRPQAYWDLADDGDGVVCSHCGTDFCIMVFQTEYFKFCPNCGAKIDREHKIIRVDFANGESFNGMG